MKSLSERQRKSKLRSIYYILEDEGMKYLIDIIMTKKNQSIVNAMTSKDKDEIMKSQGVYELSLTIESIIDEAKEIGETPP